jgi:hypothetical protein
MFFFSVFSRMFFRPEEYTCRSERIDNAVILEMEQIDVRDKDDRFAPFLFDRVVEITVYLDFHFPGAVRTFRLNTDRQVLLP